MSLNTYAISVNKLKTLSPNQLLDMANNFNIRLPVCAETPDTLQILSNHLLMLHDHMVYQETARPDSVLLAALGALENKALRDIAGMSFIKYHFEDSNKKLAKTIAQAVHNKTPAARYIHRLDHHGLVALANQLGVIHPEEDYYNRYTLVRAVHAVLHWALPSLDDYLFMLTYTELHSWAESFDMVIPQGLDLPNSVTYLVSHIDMNNLQSMLTKSAIRAPATALQYWPNSLVFLESFTWPYGLPAFNKPVVGTFDPELTRVFCQTDKPASDDEPKTSPTVWRSNVIRTPLKEYRSNDQKCAADLLRFSPVSALMLLSTCLNDAGVKIVEPTLNKPVETWDQTEFAYDPNTKIVAGSLAMVSKRELITYVRTLVPVTTHTTMSELFFSVILSNQHLLNHFATPFFLRHFMKILNKHTPSPVLLTDAAITAAQVRQGLSGLPTGKMPTILKALSKVYNTGNSSSFATFVLSHGKLLRYHDPAVFRKAGDEVKVPKRV